MAIEEQNLFLNKLSQDNYFQYTANWNGNMERLDGFTHSEFWPIFKDGKMFVSKSIFHSIILAKLQRYPYRNKNLDSVINDFKNLSRRNYYAAKFIEENDSFYTFEYGAGVPLSPNNIQRALPQLKKYFEFNKNVENDLRVQYMGELFYDELRNKVKLVDLSSLWYTDHMIDEDSVIQNYYDPGILFSQNDDNTVVIYSFLPDSTETRKKIQKYIDVATADNHTCTVKYV